MYVLLIGLIVLAALLMCLVVLAQNSKGGGLSSSFASSNQIMGVRKTTDFIEKLTWGLAAFMVVCSVLTAYFVPSVQTEKSVIMDEALKESATNPLNNATSFPAAASDNAGAAAATDGAAAATDGAAATTATQAADNQGK